jgi:hypothetical protein
MTHVFSPYQIHPFNLNPLKSVLSEVVDFDRLAKCKMAPRLFLSATNVRTGKIKVLENDVMSVEVVLASSFNSSLMRERAVAFVTKLIDDNVLDRGNATMRRWPSSELRPSSIQIGTSCVACDSGRAKAAEWLDSNFTRSGNRPRSISPRSFFRC